MKYDPKEEILVLQTIKILGQATSEEIEEYLKLKFEHEVGSETLERIVKRWEKRNVITSCIFQNARVYSLMDIPWLGRLQMMQVTGIPDMEAKKLLGELEEQAKLQSAVGGKGPLYTDYVSLKCVFETLDDVAGGDLGPKERFLLFPKDRNGKPYIKPNWMRAFLRDNVRLINESSLFDYVAMSPGRFLEEPKLVVKKARVKEGHCDYETVPPGSKFEMTMRFPLKGFQNLRSVEDVKNFFSLVAEAPISGIGAHSSNFGGRIALIDIRGDQTGLAGTI